MNKKTCGECPKFLYENIDGYGVCNATNRVCYCGDNCQDLFKPRQSSPKSCPQLTATIARQLKQILRRRGETQTQIIKRKPPTCTRAHFQSIFRAQEDYNIKTLQQLLDAICPERYTIRIELWSNKTTTEKLFAPKNSRKSKAPLKDLNPLKTSK